MITSKITSRGQSLVSGDTVAIRAHPGALASFGALALKSKASSVDDVRYDAVRDAAREGWADHVAEEGRESYLVDAYLAAEAEGSGRGVASFDRDFRKFTEIDLLAL